MNLQQKEFKQKMENIIIEKMKVLNEIELNIKEENIKFEID